MTGPPPRSGRRLHRDSDAGAGTVLVVGLVATLLTLVMATGALVQAERARSGAQSAADLAALAAASQLVRARAGEACRIAGEVAARNGAHMTECRVEGGDVVQIRTARPAGVGTATARARAGPVAARPGPVEARAGSP